MIICWTLKIGFLPTHRQANEDDRSRLMPQRYRTDDAMMRVTFCTTMSITTGLPDSEIETPRFRERLMDVLSPSKLKGLQAAERSCRKPGVLVDATARKDRARAVPPMELILNRRGAAEPRIHVV